VKDYLGVDDCTAPEGEPVTTGVGDSRTFSIEYIRCGGLLEKLTGGDGTSSGSVQNQRDPHLKKSTKQINKICDKYTFYAFSLHGEQSHTPHFYEALSCANTFNFFQLCLQTYTSHFFLQLCPF